MKRRPLLHMRTKGLTGPAFAKHHQVPGLSKSAGNTAGEQEPPDAPQFDDLGTWPATFTMYEEAPFSFNAKPYWASGGHITSWSLQGASVPPWLTINSSGVIRGTPPAGSAGTFSFTVVGDNVTGPPASSTSIDATIMVNVQITFSPQSQFVEIGSPVTFATQATAATAYQWYRNSTPISGATNFAYTTPPITQADDLAQYTCRVTGVGGVTRDTTPAAVTAMQKFNNLENGGSVVLQITLAAGTYTLSMLGSGLTTIKGITATIAGL